MADLSQALNYAALIENSTARSSPPGAAAPALAVATRLAPNPRTISSAISGDSPRDRPCPIPPCSSQWPSPLRSFNSIYFILLCTYYSHLALLSVRPFGRHPSEATVAPRRGSPRPSARVTPRCSAAARPDRGAAFGAWAAPRAAPTALGAALLAPSRSRCSFFRDSGTGHGSVRLLYRFFEPRGTGYPEGQPTPHPHHTHTGHPEGQLFFAASPRPSPSCGPFTATSLRGDNFWENIYT